MKTTQTRLRLRIEQDIDPCNPRKEFENFSTMVCWHRRYSLGDVDKPGDIDRFFDNLALNLCPGYRERSERIETAMEHFNGRGGWEGRLESIQEKELGKAITNVVVLPLYLYDHSGVSISTGGFSCPWDSGQVGWAYVTLEKARENWMLPEATWETMVESDGKEISLINFSLKLIKAEVETYDQYLRGDVHGFIVESSRDGGETWEHEESCWGFYGEADAKAAALAEIQSRLEREAELLTEREAVEDLTVVPPPLIEFCYVC